MILSQDHISAHIGVWVWEKKILNHVSISDLLFGVPGKYTGVSPYNRKRVVTYTITMVLSKYDAR